MALKLYSFSGDSRSFKACIAAQYNGVKIDLPAFDVHKDATSPEFLAKSPAGTLPLLETPSGCIFGSNAIARYIARIRADTQLLGRNFFESGQVDSWCEFSVHEVELPVSLCVYPLVGMSESNPAVESSARSDLLTALSKLEAHLLSRTFLVGEAVTLADIVVVSGLTYAFKLLLTAEEREAVPSVTRWFHTCVNQPAFRAVIGDVVFAAEAGATTEPAAASAAAKPKAAKAEKAKKEEKPKEEKPKEEKKKEEKKKAAEEDDDPAAAALREEPKKANPLASLPKSPMDLDAWKREYSNSKHDYYASMPYFWSHLDTAGWSLWLQKYRYNNENVRDFMTSNLVGGFIQRSDDMRRYAFGVMYVLNEEKPFEVEGLWLLRGQEVGPMLEANPDADSYEWTRLDPTDEAVKKMVGDYWCTNDKLNGKTVYDSKVFK